MVVYSANYFIQFIYFLFLFMYVVLSIVGINVIKNGNKYSKMIGIPIFACGLIFITYFAIIFISSDVRTYNDTYKKYKNGDYKEVEGYVRSFKIEQDGDKKSEDEEFYIGGVHFVVYAGGLWPYYYSPSNNGGGLIHCDGQYVSVKYETHVDKNGNARNYIMEIYVPPMEE